MITNEIGLAIFIVLMTVIGSFYYLRVIKVMYFDDKKGLAEVISSKWVTYFFIIFGIAGFKSRSISQFNVVRTLKYLKG